MNSVLGFTYQNLLKPILFRVDAEKVHDGITVVGEALGQSETARKLLGKTLRYENEKLEQKVSGVGFVNPIGLAAGFDYDGHLAEVMKPVGFGFNTVGTVTARPYEGNKKPRLGRLPKSRSLLVNKGFKSEGVIAVVKRLDEKNLKGVTLGLSVGSSNLPEVNTISKAIDDYLYSFEYLRTRKYIKYFELNISCPNTAMTESFGNKKNLEKLVKEVQGLKVRQPIFVKMANEISTEVVDELVRTALKYKMAGFVFSNLVKDRSSNYLDRAELAGFEGKKGNFSGRPTFENSNKLIAYVYKKFGRDCKIIGCGGVFSAADAYKKIKLGASLVEMITGLIYEGPQVVGEINRGLVEFLDRDGYRDISEAVGSIF